jgi:predicted transposase/invertase (TIGR01784 family)
VQEVLKAFLPPRQLAHLNLSTLQLASESFIGEDLREYFSDLVYTCETIQGEPVRVCLLLEHKSTSTGRRIYVQLGNYLRSIQDEDIRQGRKYFTITLPVLIYQGEEAWELLPLRQQYGPVPEDLEGYIPHFDIVMLSVHSLTDEFIFIEGLQESLLLRNVLLVLKHARDTNYLREHFSQLLIFASENVGEELSVIMFRATFLYVQQVSTFSKEEMMNLIQTLPPPYEQHAKSTYEQILEEGFEKGLEKGREEILRAFLRKNPEWSDEQVAAVFEVSIEWVRNIRSTL